MKRIIVVLLLVLLFGLVGCGESNAPAVNSGDVQEEPSKSETQETAVEATKTPKNAEAIQDDYEKNATIFQEGGDPLHIKEFVINKRRTDETSFADTVYVTATLVSESGVIQFIQDCVMTYGLYNEGWILDEITVTETKDMPLSGTDYSEEELEEIVRSIKYHNIMDVVLYDHVTNLEDGKDCYYIGAKDAHKYMTENLKLELDFNFDSMFGWNLSPSNIYVTASEIQWHIDGQYAVYNANSGEKWNNRIVTINYDNHLIDDDEYSFFSTDRMTFKEFAVNNIYRDDDLANGGYSAQLTNADWGEILIIAAKPMGGFVRDYYFGKDHIYYSCDTAGRDSYNHVIEFKFDAELLPIQ